MNTFKFVARFEAISHPLALAPNEPPSETVCHHFYRPHPKDGEGTVFSLFVSSHPRGGYLPWPGGRLPTLAGGGVVPTLARWRLPTLAEEGVTYLGRVGLPTLGQSTTASACYAAGGMPLAFTQEDFLVIDW